MSHLNTAESFLFEHVRPIAETIDQNLDALLGILKKMGDERILGLRVPKEYGGAGLSPTEFRRFQETCSRCSGSLAFLQTQHQSGCNFISQTDKEPLKSDLLPKLAAGELTVGIAFSQLRRKGPPVLTACETDGGFLISGLAPWVTGWQIFDKCITAAALPSGDSLWFVHDLRESESQKAGEVMNLAAMEIVQTVAITFSDFFVPNSDVLYTRPPGWIHDSDMINLALQSPFALGCAQGAVDLLQKLADEKKIASMISAGEALQSELSAIRDEAYSAMEDKEDHQRSLRARAAAIEIMGRCAHAAVIASSGAGNSMKHAAQRIYREAIVFSVSAQTEPILSASLEKLVNR